MKRMIITTVASLALASLSSPLLAQETPYPVEATAVTAPSPEEQIATLQARLAQQEQALQNHRTLLAQARAEGALKDELLILGRTRNAELYGIASEILDRYAGVGIGE